MDDQLKQSALDFHEFPVPGKIQVSPTKPLATQRDLALAYSPGVAAPCLEIEKDPLKAYKYTARGNLVAVISNGTAVLGLGNIGALESGKPEMIVTANIGCQTHLASAGRTSVRHWIEIVEQALEKE